MSSGRRGSKVPRRSSAGERNASATLTPLEDGAGNETRMAGAVAQAALQIDGMQLANARGSRWTDPDLRSWEGDSGTLHRFRWSG